MSRLQNLDLVYRIVVAYNVQFNKPMYPLDLINYIKKKTGVRTETARDYITSLENGIFAKGKLLKIVLKGRGFIPWME